MLYSGRTGLGKFMYNTIYSPAIACAVPFDGTQHVLPQFIA